MKIAIFCLIVSFTFACVDAGRPVQNTASANVTPGTGKPETMAAHTTENQPPKPYDSAANNSAAPAKRPQMGDPIDTTEFDAAIMVAEKTISGKPADGGAKKALGTAYLKRAVALTDARQYASALGDYRRTLKYDPVNSEAKTWIDQIMSIYSSMGRPSPKEGEEPAALPFKKS